MKSELEDLIASLPEHWCQQFRLVPDQSGMALAVATPFVFEDGDALPVFIDYDREHGVWTLSDHGQALWHLGYEDDWEVTETRVSRIRVMVENSGGEFSETNEITVEVDEAPDAFVIADFIQIVAAVSGLPLQTSTAERPQFGTRARSVVTSWLPKETQYETNWHDEDLDPHGHWPVDLRIWRGLARSPIDSVFVATPEPMWRAGLTLTTFRDLEIHSEKLVVYQVGRHTDSSALYGLQETAQRLGAQVLPVSGEPSDMTMSSVRRSLEGLGVVLRA